MTTLIPVSDAFDPEQACRAAALAAARDVIPEPEDVQELIVLARFIVTGSSPGDPALLRIPEPSEVPQTALRKHCRNMSDHTLHVWREGIGGGETEPRWCEGTHS